MDDDPDRREAWMDERPERMTERIDHVNEKSGRMTGCLAWLDDRSRRMDEGMDERIPTDG